MTESFKNRVVLVTGSAGDIGRAIVRACASAGARVAMHCHEPDERIRELRCELEEMGAEAEVFVAELAHEPSCARLIEEVYETFGRFDVLVNNAAVTPHMNDESREVFDAPSWQQTLDVNLRAPYLLSTGAGERMRSAGFGRIVNIVSASALRADGSSTPMILSKSALDTLTRVLARRFAPNVTVNAVAPGVICTSEIQSRTGEPKKRIDDLVARVPAKRMGEPSDIAAAVLFLAAPEAGYMTGYTLAVDGGLTLL